MGTARRGKPYYLFKVSGDLEDLLCCDYVYKEKFDR
jgi:hypothetical protein